MMVTETAPLYLSRLCLDGRARAVRRELANCQALHCTLLGAFPPLPPGEKRARQHFGLLYRVEAADKEGVVPALVQSHERPDWSRLPHGYLRPTWDMPEGYAVKSIGGFYTELKEGHVLRFRLRANPTKRVSPRNEAERDPRWHGKRVELQREEDQLSWLARKGEAGGFRLLAVAANRDVPDVRATHGLNVTGKRQDTGRLTFGSVLFEGRLTITDANAFRQALTTGIGSGKAYGFGLLSIAPA